MTREGATGYHDRLTAVPHDRFYSNLVGLKRMSITQSPIYKIRPNLTNIELETLISALRFRIESDTHWNIDLELLEKLVILKAANDAKHGLTQPSSNFGQTDYSDQTNSRSNNNVLKKAKLLGVLQLTEEEKIIEIKHRAETGQPITDEEQEKLNEYLISQL